MSRQLDLSDGVKDKAEDFGFIEHCVKAGLGLGLCTCVRVSKIRLKSLTVVTVVKPSSYTSRAFSMRPLLM